MRRSRRSQLSGGSPRTRVNRTIVCNSIRSQSSFPATRFAKHPRSTALAKAQMNGETVIGSNLEGEVLIDRGRNTRSMFATFIQPVGGGVCSSFTLQAARGGFASSTIARIVHRTFSPRMLAAMMCMILFNLSHCEFFFQNMSPQQLVETSSVTQEATAPCRLPLPVLCTIYETFFQLHLRSSGVEESG